MADNYLEKRYEEVFGSRGASASRGVTLSHPSLEKLLHRNRTCLRFDLTYTVHTLQLDAIIAVNAHIDAPRPNTVSSHCGDAWPRPDPSCSVVDDSNSAPSHCVAYEPRCAPSQSIASESNPGPSRCVAPESRRAPSHCVASEPRCAPSHCVTLSELFHFRSVVKGEESAAVSSVTGLNSALEAPSCDFAPGTSLPLESPSCGSAPEAFIIVCGPSSTPGPDTLIALGMSLQTMSLKAVDLGLGSLIISDFDKAALKAALNLPSVPLAILAIGKPLASK